MIFFSNPYLQYLERKKDIAKSLEIFFKKGNYILGSEVTNFEKSFANYCQAKYGIGVNSGTDAILLALKSLDIGIGDERLGLGGGEILQGTGKMCVTPLVSGADLGHGRLVERAFHEHHAMLGVLVAVAAEIQCRAH